MIDLKNLGAHIRSIRLEKGLSQGDMEKATGMLRCALSRIENGHMLPSLSTVQKLAEAMNVRVSRLLGEQDGDK